MKDKFNIGDRVRTPEGQFGKIASQMFEIRAEPQYAIKLDKGFWSEGRSVYVSHLIVHESNLRIW